MNLDVLCWKSSKFFINNYLYPTLLALTSVLCVAWSHTKNGISLISRCKSQSWWYPETRSFREHARLVLICGEALVPKIFTFLLRFSKNPIKVQIKSLYKEIKFPVIYLFVGGKIFLLMVDSNILKLSNIKNNILNNISGAKYDFPDKSRYVKIVYKIMSGRFNY